MSNPLVAVIDTDPIALFTNLCQVVVVTTLPGQRWCETTSAWVDDLVLDNEVFLETLPIRYDDKAKMPHLQTEADAVLAASGWVRISEWTREKGCLQAQVHRP